MEPAAILNLASLSIHVPPLPLDSHPPPTSLAQQDASQLAAVDDWISTLSVSPEREETYYDESLPFYLVVRLPTTPLTRAQATSLLLHSLPTPHLTFSADLSYLESRTQSRSSIGLGRPPVALDLNGGWEEPSTPMPFPSTRKGEGASQGAGLPAWSWAWVEGGGEGKGKGRENKWGEGRVWVGREGGEEGVGGWIGVWEFRGDVAFVKSSLLEPKLCLTVTMTFRDDPRLHDVLERTSSPSPIDASASHDDEYLIESFDDVNLLEGLDDYLHLPASRLPRPLPSSSAPPRRTPHRSLSLSIPDTLHPVTRHSARRVLRVRSALAVRMREVPCVAFGVERRGVGGEAAVEGMAISVEVAGTGERGDGFEVESVELLVTGGSGAGDVEVKELAAGRTEEFPILLGSKDQFSFLYSVTYTGRDETSTFDEPPLPAPVPIYVATSPSQRFTSRFGDGHPSSLVEPPPPIPSKSNVWVREVVIVVTGRPVRIDRSGYTVPNGEEATKEYPTTSFASKWNCILDISPFALRAQSHRASFTPLPQPRHLTSSNRNSTPSTRRSKPPPILEAVAGSKRHTIAGLATLLEKAPALPHSLPRLSLSFPSYDPSRALPPTPLEAPTPGATGRRFFSLPAGGTPPRSPLDPRTPRSPLPFAQPPMTPAYPPHSSAREAFPVVERGWEEKGKESILVSVALIPLRGVKETDRVESRAFGEEGVRKEGFQFPLRERGSGEEEEEWRTPRVGVLDVFLVEVFVLNRGDEVKRFTVGVPPRRGEGDGLGKDDRVATLVALENDVRIGPLAPQTCQSVRMRFVAMRPGAHVLEELRLVDLGTGRETRLRNPVGVVVEG